MTATKTIGALAQDINMYDAQAIREITQEAMTAAKTAALAHLEQHGEHAYCGFAWVEIFGIKGNTKLGRAMKQAGLEKDYKGAYSIWNPSGLGTQCMSTKEAGAQAAVEVFRKYGFDRCYMGSRAD